MQQEELSRAGKVEQVPVQDILLDTGASTTLVRKDLIPEEMIGGEISIRCAHGDVVFYPLAEIEVEVGGRQLVVQAAVADKLPVSMLLGRDVPEMGRLLRKEGDVNVVPQKAMVVTRAQKRPWNVKQLLWKRKNDRMEPNRIHLRDQILERDWMVRMRNRIAGSSRNQVGIWVRILPRKFFARGEDERGCRGDRNGSIASSSILARANRMVHRPHTPWI